MLYVYEFELCESEGMVVAFPFDFLGGTQGSDLAEASEMAADWLKTELEYRLMGGEDIPEATLGHDPERDGGRILLVAVDASLDTVKAVTATKAAEMLGVSRPRISQMLKAQKLIGYRKGRDTFVTVDSVNARLAESPKSGRPKAKA